MIRLGYTYGSIEIQVLRNGVLANADSTPVCVLRRNGVNSGEVVTITNPSTGRYLASFTTLLASAGWSEDDHIVLHTTALIDGVSYSNIHFDSYGAGVFGGGSGSGANIVSITVDDGTDPIEGANVRLTKGADTFVVTTDVDGLAEFSLNDGTWTVTITQSGYSFIPTTLVVDGNETQTYSMTQTVLTPSDPGQVTGYLYCYGTNGAVTAGVVVTLMQLRPISGSGIAYNGATRSQTSGADGLVQFTGLFLGGRYRLYRGLDDQHPVSFTIDSDQTDPMELPSVIDTP